MKNAKVALERIVNTLPARLRAGALDVLAAIWLADMTEAEAAAYCGMRPERVREIMSGFKSIGKRYAVSAFDY